MKEALLKAAGTGFSQPPDQVAWEGLDEPWTAARFAGRRWHGIARRLEGASLAVALDGEAPCARLLRVEATQAHDGAWRVIEEPLPAASPTDAAAAPTHPENESEDLIFDLM
ncbi:MAG TPA: hypothetical protein VJ743_12085 [Albitalea sp.]|nr:hypothetical protein [Albitalea sp.]